MGWILSGLKGGISGGGNLWKPSDSAGLSDWFTASHTPSVTTPNGNVTSWTTRRSGGTNNLATATGTPTHDGSSINFLNGNHTLSDTSIDNGAISNGSCMLYVVLDTDKVASHYIVNYDDAGANPGLALRYWQPTNSWYAYCNAAGSTGNVSASAAGTAANAKVLLGLLITGTSLSISVNGTWTSGGTATPFTSTRMILNRTGTSLGRIYDIESFTTYDVGTAQRIEGELAAKHGITLPNGHPYRLGAPTTAWTPADDTGLQVWYDFADSSTITVTGAGISQLLNKAAAGGYTLAQSTDANRPSWDGSAATGRSTGTGLAITTTVAWSNAAYQSLGVYSATGFDGVNSRLFFNVLNGASTNHALFCTSTANNFRQRTSSAGTGTGELSPVAGYVPGTKYLITTTFDGTTTKGAFVNGLSAFSDTSANNGPISGTDFRLLSAGPGTTLGSFIVTSSTATALRQKHEGFQAWDKGVQANLDAGHPYKSRPPLLSD